MSIVSYATLQTAIGGWLGHELTSSRNTDFIAMFEASANRRLRVRQMETSTSLTPDSSGDATLPTDYLAWRQVIWTGSPAGDLQYVPPSYITSAYPTAPSGTPSVFTVEGTQVKIMPLSTTALTFLYYQKIPALSVTDPNWLLTAHPDLYLFGSLCEAEMFLLNDERMPLWKARRDEIYDEVNLLYRARGQTTMAVLGATP